MGTWLLVPGQRTPPSAKRWAPGEPQGHPCIPGAPSTPKTPVPGGLPLTWRDAPVTAEMPGRRARGGTAPGAAGGASPAAGRRCVLPAGPAAAAGPGPARRRCRWMAATAFRRRRQCGYARRGADLRPPCAGVGGAPGPPAAGCCAPRIPRGHLKRGRGDSGAGKGGRSSEQATRAGPGGEGERGRAPPQR